MAVDSPPVETPQPGQNDGAWGFSTKDAGRIAHVVRRIEGQYYERSKERAKYGGFPMGLVPAQLNAGIASGTIAAPTTAQATRLLATPGSAVLSPTGGAIITVFNTYAVAIANGKTIWCIYFGSNWYIVQADC
jgi:hypothetical protein